MGHSLRGTDFSSHSPFAILLSHFSPIIGIFAKWDKTPFNWDLASLQFEIRIFFEFHEFANLNSKLFLSFTDTAEPRKHSVSGTKVMFFYKYHLWRASLN